VRRFVQIVSIGLGIVALGTGCSEGVEVPAGPSVRVGVRPGDDFDATRASFAPVAGALTAALGVAVHIVPTESYDATLEAFTAGDITLAWLGEIRVPRAAEAVPGARAIAGALRPDAGFYIIANPDTDLEWSDQFPDLADRAWVFGPERSTAGDIVPAAVMRERMGAMQGPVRYTTTTRETIEWVVGGKAEVGMVPHREYDALLIDGAIDSRTCRVIWKSPPYQNERFVAHPDIELEFGPDFMDRVQAALVGLDDVMVLKPFGHDGFSEISP
jgi:phosphonate transport system substrate-binding protein